MRPFGKLPVPSVAAIAVVALLAACGESPPRPGEPGAPAAEAAPATAAPAAAPASAAWPDDLPAGVLRFQAGTIIDVTRSELSDATVWGIMLTGVERDAAVRYRDDLAAAGWQTYSGALIDEEMAIYGADLDRTRVDVAWARENRALSITVTARK